MTKKKLEKEACNWLRKYLLCCNCENKCNCIDSNSYCEKQVLKAYVDSAEPREKRIVELERKLEQTEKDLADYQFNYPTIKELQKENAELYDNLTKAKEIIKKLVNGIRVLDDPKVELTNCDVFLANAEQFLNDIKEV